MASNRKWEEWHLTLSWGTLRGKILRAMPRNGDKVQRVVCLHGHLDNCHSFVPLLPFFPANTEVLFPDLPGHGFSDHFSHGMTYDPVTMTVNLAMAIKKFGWDSFILIGHSYGSFISILIASVHPEWVTALVSIDLWGWVPKVSSKELQKDVSYIERERVVNESNSFTKEEAAHRMIAGRVYRREGKSSIGMDEAMILVERQLKPNPVNNELFNWSYDFRATALFRFPYDTDFQRKLLSKIQTPMLIVAAENGLINQRGLDPEVIHKSLFNVQHMHRVTIPGGHHIHMVHPHIIWKYIELFFDSLKVKSKM